MSGIVIVIETLPEPVSSDIESGRIVIVAEGADGDKLAVMLTLPENPFWLERPMRYVPCDPSSMVCDKRLVAIKKSGLFGVEVFPANNVPFAYTPPTTPKKTRNMMREARTVLSSLSGLDSDPVLLRVQVFRK